MSALVYRDEEMIECLDPTFSTLNPALDMPNNLPWPTTPQDGNMQNWATRRRCLWHPCFLS
jgi:hypothetical protein